MKLPKYFNGSLISTKGRPFGYVRLILCMTIGLSACKKVSPAGDISMANIQSGPVNIYLAGFRPYYPSNEVATYWKNGVLTDLTSGAEYITANSIAVSGNDIYVGGNQYVNYHWVAKYWKNGSIANFADTSKESYVSAATVSGSDIYFAGYENEGNYKIAKYWKNGHGVGLTSGLTDAVLTAITVWGNDVYASGWELKGNVEVAKYWKNGSAISLSDGTNNTEAQGIVVWGNDIYVLLTEYIKTNDCLQCGSAWGATVFKIWKNGSVIKTADANQTFTSIAVSNNVLYIAGNVGNAMGYFKNDIVFPITNGTWEAEASGIAIWGSDVYITGYENIAGHNVPTYWKNGTPTRLADSINNAYADAIYLGKQ